MTAWLDYISQNPCSYRLLVRAGPRGYHCRRWASGQKAEAIWLSCMVTDLLTQPIGMLQQPGLQLPQCPLNLSVSPNPGPGIYGKLLFWANHIHLASADTPPHTHYWGPRQKKWHGLELILVVQLVLEVPACFFSPQSIFSFVESTLWTSSSTPDTHKKWNSCN